MDPTGLFETFAVTNQQPKNIISDRGPDINEITNELKKINDVIVLFFNSTPSTLVSLFPFDPLRIYIKHLSSAK